MLSWKIRKQVKHSLIKLRKNPNEERKNKNNSFCDVNTTTVVGEDNMKEYLSTHKMMVELDNVEKGEDKTIDTGQIDAFKSTNFVPNERLNLHEIMNENNDSILYFSMYSYPCYCRW